MFKTNYSSFTSRSSNGGAEEKEKTGWNSVHDKNWGSPTPLNADVFYFFESHPIYDHAQGSSVDFITL
jgi:hypothetical protein